MQEDEQTERDGEREKSKKRKSPKQGQTPPQSRDLSPLGFGVFRQQHRRRDMSFVSLSRTGFARFAKYLGKPVRSNGIKQNMKQETIFLFGLCLPASLSITMPSITC